MTPAASGAQATTSRAPRAAVVPGPPIVASVQRGDASATVSWLAPRSDGGAPITAYVVTSSPGARTCTWSTGDLACTVTGLVNGRGYTFTVQARNSAGLSLPSVASQPVTPAGVPSAPTIGTVTAAIGSATVRWSAPLSTGGATITGYTVTSYPDQKTCVWASGPLQCTVQGLTSTKAYVFRVTARNSVGPSAESLSSLPVVPAFVPSAPSGVTAVAGRGQALVSWQPPRDSGGAAITSYTVISSPDGRSCTSATGTLSCTVTGLTNGKAYTFTVTARNAAGTSAASAPSPSTTPKG